MGGAPPLPHDFAPQGGKNVHFFAPRGSGARGGPWGPRRRWQRGPQGAPWCRRTPRRGLGIGTPGARLTSHRPEEEAVMATQLHHLRLGETLHPGDAMGEDGRGSHRRQVRTLLG